MNSDTLLSTPVATTTYTTTATLQPSLELISITLTDNFVHYLNYLEKVPGGSIILRYIRSSYKNDPVRSLFELALFMFAVHYFLSSKRKENKSEVVKFSKKEIDELINEWEPAPLVESVTPEENWNLKSTPEVKGPNGSHIHLKDHESLTPVANLASYDFLDLSQNDDIKSAAKAVINTAGVGACGPPNFYGTQDVHVRLEEDLAEYLGAEAAILYGQDYVTAGSVIPAFLKRGDLVIADSGVNVAIQKALIISRCDIEWFDHNDVEHLEQILKELKPELDKHKPIRRRFIVTEGIFANSGDVAALPRIVELKNEYKYRLFVDETLSIGVLGKTGRGICEYFGIPRSEASITIGTLANAFASSGGFCVGVEPMIYHQRIQSNAYVFSAALPPYSAKVTSEAIKKIAGDITEDGQSILVKALHDKLDFVFKSLTTSSKKSNYFKVVSDENSPILHLGLKDTYREQLGFDAEYGSDEFLLTGKARTQNKFSDNFNIESFILQKIVDEVLAKTNILISRSKQLIEHENLPIVAPRLLIIVNNGVSAQELTSLVEFLPLIVDQVCSKINGENDLSRIHTELLNY